MVFGTPPASACRLNQHQRPQSTIQWTKSNHTDFRTLTDVAAPIHRAPKCNECPNCDVDRFSLQKAAMRHNHNSLYLFAKSADPIRQQNQICVIHQSDGESRAPSSAFVSSNI